MHISTRNTGLGNRIKSLVSCFRLDTDARIYWPPEINIYLDNNGRKVLHRKPITFNDLFENDIAIQKPFPADAIIYDSWRLAILPTDKLPVGFSESKFSDYSPDGRTIDFEYLRIPKRIRKTYAAEFKKLVVKKEIQESIDRKINEIGDSFISVHIRSWSDQGAKKRRKSFSLDKFIEEIKTYNIKQKFFVASDSIEILESLEKIFKEQICYYMPNKERTTVDDLIDLYILSHGSEIIGSSNSTYTECIFWLSGANKNIKVI